MARLPHEGYGQLELNKFAASRDGRIEAQYAIKKGEFANDELENGSIVAIDSVNGVYVSPKNATEGMSYGLVYSEEKVYDERFGGALNKFVNKAEGFFLPRVGYLAIGDVFTTNTVDTGEVDIETIKAGTVFGGVSDTGAILLSTTAPTKGPVLKAIKKTTMPDDEVAVKFKVIKE